MTYVRSVRVEGLESYIHKYDHDMTSSTVKSIELHIFKIDIFYLFILSAGSQQLADATTSVVGVGVVCVPFYCNISGIPPPT